MFQRTQHSGDFPPGASPQMTDEAGEKPPETENFAELFAREEARKSYEIGQIVRGRVVQIGEKETFLDIGAKSEAAIATAELLDEAGAMLYKVGDMVEATVTASTTRSPTSARRSSSGSSNTASGARTSSFPAGGSSRRWPPRRRRRRGRPPCRGRSSTGPSPRSPTSAPSSISAAC